jgi:hypothetical protein
MDEVIQEISNLVAVACQPIFRELAPTHKDVPPQKRDLYKFLNPETFKLQLATLMGSRKP